VLKCIRPHSDMRHIHALFAVAHRAFAPVIIGIALISLAAPAGAQSVASRDAELFANAGSNPVATVRKGAPVAVGQASGAYVQATIDGWVAAALLGGARDSFPLTVKPGSAVRLRSSASAQATVVADLRGGMGLSEVERQGAWVHVRRTGWLPAKALVLQFQAATQAPAPAPQATNAPAAAQGSATPPPAPAGPDTTRNGLVLTPVAQTSIAASPGGERLGSLGPGARATVTGRERGWVRVRVEGWVREADLSVADTALRGALSAADLRADPDGTAGRLVHWEVEVLAHQVADPLRKGLADQEPYLLAQGPSGENALLYLAIPPALAATAREIPDLGRAIITARVRSGRSEPVGIPVLELLTIVGR
jgi:hypothetical protein